MKSHDRFSEDERWYRDGELVAWHVREVDASALRSPRGVWCLVFESDYRMRRVWRYPDGWSLLGDTALEALSWQK